MSWADDCELEYVLNDLEAENAKLRKLCTQMAMTVDCTLSDKRCALFTKCESERFESCLYEQELRELGIEVN